MKLFLDTSSLFKLYHNEPGADEIDNLFNQARISDVYLSEITKIEFASAVWKRARNRDITSKQADGLIGYFKEDFGKFVFVGIDSIIVEQAQRMIAKYGAHGLRTLDSIQLATSVILKGKVDLNRTSDKLLEQFFKQEGLNT